MLEIPVLSISKNLQKKTNCSARTMQNIKAPRVKYSQKHWGENIVEIQADENQTLRLKVLGVD